jgi:hypothetical protein
MIVPIWTHASGPGGGRTDYRGIRRLPSLVQRGEQGLGMHWENPLYHGRRARGAGTGKTELLFDSGGTGFCP